MKYVLTILIVTGMFGAINIYGQDEPILINPSITPVYPGGDTALHELIAKNIEYPEQEKDLLTKAYFVVDIDTSGVAKFDGLFGITEDLDVELLEKELTRIIGLMPKWKPGTESGVKVPMKIAYHILMEIK